MRPIMGIACCCASASLVAVAVAEGPATADWEIKPALLRGSDNHTPDLGARFEASARYFLVPPTGPKGYVQGETHGVLALDQHSQSENIVGEVSAGLTVNTYRPGSGYAAYPGAEGMDNAHTQSPTKHDTWGRFDLAAHARFETDQPFENYDIACGSAVTYVRGSSTGWWSLVPAVAAAYDRVAMLHSELYRDLNADEGTFNRWSVAAAWCCRVGSWVSPGNRIISPLGVALDLRRYHSTDLPSAVEDDGQDDANYVAGSITYELTDRGFQYLRNVYVTVARGRLPPATEDETTVYVGLIVGAKKDRSEPSPSL